MARCRVRRRRRALPSATAGSSVPLWAAVANIFQPRGTKNAEFGSRGPLECASGSIDLEMNASSLNNCVERVLHDVSDQASWHPGLRGPRDPWTHRLVDPWTRGSVLNCRRTRPQSACAHVHCIVSGRVVTACAFCKEIHGQERPSKGEINGKSSGRQ